MQVGRSDLEIAPALEETKSLTVLGAHIPSSPAISRYYLDAQFSEPKVVDFVAFRNHYTAFVTVKLKPWLSDTWITCNQGVSLMADLHFEEDAQDYHVIALPKEHPAVVSAGGLGSIRLYISQPSPRWLVSCEVFNKREHRILRDSRSTPAVENHFKGLTPLIPFRLRSI